MNANNYRGGFRELNAWKEARVFRQIVKGICDQLPKEEKYSLADQLRRSSRSVTANIAEGYGRYTYQETSQFFRQSRGSLNESLDHLTTALDEGYITNTDFVQGEQQYEKVLKLINGYIAFLQKEKQTNSAKPWLPNT